MLVSFILERGEGEGEKGRGGREGRRVREREGEREREGRRERDYALLLIT